MKTFKIINNEKFYLLLGFGNGGWGMVQYFGASRPALSRRSLGADDLRRPPRQGRLHLRTSDLVHRVKAGEGWGVLKGDWAEIKEGAPIFGGGGGVARDLGGR